MNIWMASDSKVRNFSMPTSSPKDWALKDFQVFLSSFRFLGSFLYFLVFLFLFLPCFSLVISFFSMFCYTSQHDKSSCFPWLSLFLTNILPQGNFFTFLNMVQIVIQSGLQTTRKKKFQQIQGNFQSSNEGQPLLFKAFMARGEWDLLHTLQKWNTPITTP